MKWKWKDIILGYTYEILIIYDVSICGKREKNIYL